MTDPRLRLRDIVKARSLLEGEVKLVSGRSSSFYFDMKRSVFHPEAAGLIAELVLAALGDREVDLVGGLEMGAVPLVACVAMASRGRPVPIEGFFVRKQPKEHGTKRLIEGLPAGMSLEGRRVAILEDVTTTGGSGLKAAEAAGAEGAIVDTIVTVVDRQEGASANLEPHGIRLVPILTVEDFR